MALFLIVPVFWAGLLRLSGIRLLTISIPGILMLLMLIYQYIGFPTLFFHLDDYRSQFIQDRAIIWKMFFWNCYTITMILTGYIAARKTMGPLHLPNQFNAFHKSFFLSSLKEQIILYALFGVSISVLVVYVGKVGIDNLAILKALGFLDTDSSSKALRSAMGNAFEGKYHRYQLLMRDFLSLASYGLFANWLICRKLVPFFLFCVSFVVVAFSMLMATEKGPFFWYLISLFIIYIIILNNGRLSAKMIAALAPFGMVIIGLMYVYFMESPTIWSGIQNSFSRITTGQMSGLYHYLIIFPEQVDYLLGRSFPNPGGIFPWEPYRLTVEVNNIVNPDDDARGVIGSMPTFFWGEMYSNFSYFGILVPPLFVGYVVYAANIMLFRFPMSPLTLSVFIWAILHVKSLSGTGLSSYIVDVDALIIAVFFLGSLFLIHRGVIRLQRRTIRISSPDGRLGCRFSDPENG